MNKWTTQILAPGSVVIMYGYKGICWYLQGISLVAKWKCQQCKFHRLGGYLDTNLKFIYYKPNLTTLDTSKTFLSVWLFLLATKRILIIHDQGGIIW